MISMIFKCIGMILCVPFLTLFERKGLSYIQNRKGPKKISVFGLLQPMVDGMKLMMKESGKPILSKNLMYYFSPISVFFLSLGSVLILSKPKTTWLFNLKFLFFLVLVSCNIFPLFFSGLSSKSKYSKLGSFRGAAQVIAYEVNAMVALLVIFILLKTFGSYHLTTEFKYIIMFFPGIFLMWLFCMVCETNRAPFDFAEGESELVSGYKTEYSGLNFTFLFLAEYTKIMLMSFCSSMLFFKKSPMFTLLFIFLFVWLRSTYPRFRYDLLMIFSWKVVLSFGLMILALSLMSWKIFKEFFLPSE